MDEKLFSERNHKRDTVMNISNNIGAGHATATFSDLIPLTSSASAGFMLGVLKG
jgi:hypothetical protein